MVLVLPLNLISIPLKLLLKPVFHILIPIGLVLAVVLNLIWLVCLGLFLPLSKLALAITLLRPVCFLLALPFLLLGYFANSLSPQIRMEDASQYFFKHDLVESFPYCYPLIQLDQRTLVSDENIDPQ